jgi:stress-induced-phosphoprotein 1
LKILAEIFRKINRKKKKKKKKLIKKSKAKSKAIKRQAKKRKMSSSSAEDAKNRGNKFFAQKKYMDAIDAYSEAIEKDAKQHAYYSNRCAAYCVLDMYHEAVEDAKKCTELAPTWVKGWYRLGMAYKQQGREPSAIKAFDEGLKLEPTHADIKKRRAECERVVNNYRNRTDAKTGKALSLLEAAKADGTKAYADSRYDEAIRFFTHAISLAEDFEGADDEAQRRDRLAACYANRAQCLRQHQDYHAVIDDCTEAIKLKPDYAKAYLRRGFAYEAVEKYKQGLEDMKMVQQLSPGTVEASKAITRLTNATRW